MNFEEIINGLPSQNMLLETLLWRGFAVETYQSGLLLHAQSHEQDADILEACGLDIQRTERVDESDRLFIAPQPTPDSLLKRIFELPARNGMVGAPQIDDAFETFKSNEFGPRLDTEGLDPGTALLVKALNHVGVYTVMSCDGHGVQAPQIWLRTRWDYFWCRHVLHEVWPLACRQIPWTSCKLPNTVRADYEPYKESLWNFSEDLQAGWLRYSFTWERPGFQEDLGVSVPVFWLIQSFARELLRPEITTFLCRKRSALTEDRLEHDWNLFPRRSGLDAVLERTIRYLTDCDKEPELNNLLISLRMRLDLFDSI